MLVSDFRYGLPEDLIAQQPPAVRGASRMLCVDRTSGAYSDKRFTDLPSLLQPDDLLVLNDSRVLPARLFATRAGAATQHNSPQPSGHIEVLLTSPAASADGDNDWRALVKPAKKVQPGETLHFFAQSPGGSSANPGVPTFAASSQRLGPGAPQQPILTATVLAAGEFGERTLRFTATDNFYETLDRIGHLPLPPYIHRERYAPNTAADRERYQTVYSQKRGSVAAPTAGLHFTPEILAQLEASGIEIARLTLHVGLGTFQPVRVEDTRDIRLHAEHYTLSAEGAAAINAAYNDDRRIIAVGTTTTRTLEHLAREFIATHGALAPANPLDLTAHSGSTSLFLSPAPDGDATFHLVRGLLTNLHLPQSTLLMLVSAFAGREHVLAAYAHAVAERYRFFSYGDCMLLT